MHGEGDAEHQEGGHGNASQRDIETKLCSARIAKAESDSRVEPENQKAFATGNTYGEVRLAKERENAV